MNVGANSVKCTFKDSKQGNGEEYVMLEFTHPSRFLASQKALKVAHTFLTLAAPILLNKLNNITYKQIFKTFLDT